MNKFNRVVFVLTAVLMLATVAVWAQCIDPTKHFRSGIVKQWIYQLAPGPAALAASQRIIDEINVSRAGAGLPLLVFDPNEPVQVSIVEENNPRGPDGAPLPDRTPNREVSLVTFAELDGAFDGEVAVFLTDPLRSVAALTAKGVPGASASVDRKISTQLENGRSDSAANWTFSNDSDQIVFQAKYSSEAIVARGRYPGTAAFLNCGSAHLLDVLYRTRPTETFQWFDQFQFAAVVDFTRQDVKVKLEVQHHDADVNAIFNDPRNQPLALGEYDRVIRLQRP